MKFCIEVKTLKVISTPYSLYNSVNHSKVAKVHNSDVDAIPSPFSLAQLWVTVGKHSGCKDGNEGMSFIVEQKEY
jgi:hypothetical protein